MNMGLPEFKCHVGECTYCCTSEHQERGLNLTPGDLHRIWAVHHQIYNSLGMDGYSLSQIAKGLIGGWELQRTDDDLYVPVPYGKRPCPLFNQDGKCDFYNGRIPVACKLEPEIRHPSMRDLFPVANKDPVPTCLDDTYLSAETMENIKAAYYRILEPEMAMWKDFGERIFRMGLKVSRNDVGNRDLLTEKGFSVVNPAYDTVLELGSDEKKVLTNGLLLFDDVTVRKELEDLLNSSGSYKTYAQLFCNNK